MDYAYQLELLVRKICNCERLAFDGAVDAGHLALQPFDVLQILGKCVYPAHKRTDAFRQSIKSLISTNPKIRK